MALLRLIPIWVWALLACAGVIAFQSWRLSSVHGQRDSAVAELATTVAAKESLQATLKLQRELYSEAAEADAKASKDLRHALQANKALAGRIASGDIRLRVAGTCRPSAPGAASMGDGEIELSRDAGPAYQAHREELIKERARVKFLIDRYEELRKRLGALE